MSKVFSFSLFPQTLSTYLPLSLPSFLQSSCFSCLSWACIRLKDTEEAAYWYIHGIFKSIPKLALLTKMRDGGNLGSWIGWLNFRIWSSVMTRACDTQKVNVIVVRFFAVFSWEAMLINSTSIFCSFSKIRWMSGCFWVGWVWRNGLSWSYQSSMTCWLEAESYCCFCKQEFEEVRIYSVFLWFPPIKFWIKVHLITFFT